MRPSEDINQAVEAASKSLNTNRFGELVLPARKRIWAAMGPRTVVRGRADMGVGVVRRTKLAFTAAQHVLPLWERSFSANHEPQNMLATAERYLAQQINFSTAWNLKNRFWGELERIASAGAAVGFAACQVVTTSLSDEQFDPENLDSPPCDKNLDAYEWDASFYASVAYAGSAPWEENGDIGRRHEFWRWYLQEATPLAWRSAS
jgi:hypothetical protein